MPKVATIIVLMLASCGGDGPGQPTVAGRWYTMSQVDAGRPLYATYCAVCHGAEGSATEEWRTPGPDGHYPPPPLNGTAHTWHHPLAQLDHTIATGGAEFGGVMPGFGGSLDAAQRMALIAYIQTSWPNATYEKWKLIEKRSK